MKIQKTILRETGHIALGVLIADVMMCAVFALVGRFDYTVPLGALLGSVFAVGNFFLLGLTVQNAVEKGQDVKRFVRASYTGRMLLYVVCIVLAALLPCFQTVAAIVPLFMPQVVILVMRALGLYKPEPKKQPEDAPSPQAQDTQEANE